MWYAAGLRNWRMFVRMLRGFIRRSSIRLGALFALGLLAVGLLWMVAGQPPPGLLVRYGLPGGGVTGRRLTYRGITFVELEPGYFCRGGTHLRSPGGILSRFYELVGLTVSLSTCEEHELPLAWVEVPDPLWVASTETPSWIWRPDAFSVVSRPDVFSGGGEPECYEVDHPITEISWNDASKVAESFAEGLGGFRSRLPSEAEWEYACRAGTSSRFSSGDSTDDLRSVGWFKGNSRKGVAAVGRLSANPWGFHDMHGNAWELCQDTWHPSYEGAPRSSGPWTSTPSRKRSCRGGSYASPAGDCTSSAREGVWPNYSRSDIGFRIVMLRLQRSIPR